MRSALSVTILILGLVGASPGAAQEHMHDHASPYADFTDREIKALSGAEIEGLLNGDGLGMALPAELNGYPGPKHVLELGDMLDLSPDQVREVTTIFEEMSTEAKSIGEQIVELERELDRSFADGTITEERLDERVAAIAETRGMLRAVHLRAHLRVRAMLTESQRQHYERARGYGS
jgi:hypothetical protein